MSVSLHSHSRWNLCHEFSQLIRFRYLLHKRAKLWWNCLGDPVHLDSFTKALPLCMHNFLWCLILGPKIRHLCPLDKCTYRGSYMSAHVLLNLLNELGKRDKMWGLPSILSFFRNEFNKFNNTRARMLDSIYHMPLRLLWNLISGEKKL